MRSCGRYSRIAGFKATVPKFIKGHDTIFYYIKGKTKPTFNKKYLPYNEKQLARFSNTDGEGKRYKIITKERRLYLHEAKGKSPDRLYGQT